VLGNTINCPLLKACPPFFIAAVNSFTIFTTFSRKSWGYHIKCQTRVIGYKVSTYKRKQMIDTTNPLLEKLAFEIADLHNVGGIELEQWQTAYEFVKEFYHTEEMVQIIIRGKK
jgi:hypothetical protein